MAEIRKNKKWSKELLKMKVGDKLIIPYDEKDLARAATTYQKSIGNGWWRVPSDRDKKTAKIIRLE